MPRRLEKILAVCAFSMLLCISSWSVAQADTTDNGTYGSGSYGGCAYGTCTITLSGGSTANVSVLPSSSGKCTVQSDTVSVLTDSPDGYSLTMTTNTTNSNLAGSSTNIGPTAGSAASPAVLTMNSWGYRVDNLGNFGAGPTEAQNSGNLPGHTFAAVPASNQPAAEIAYTTSPANPAADTTVWYGVCADASLPAENYTSTITYTAIAN